MSPSPQEEEWPGAGALLQSGPERRPGHYTGTHPLRTTPEGSPPGRNPVSSLNPETRLSGSVEAATRPSLHVSDWRRLREGTERTSEVVPVTSVSSRSELPRGQGGGGGLVCRENYKPQAAEGEHPPPFLLQGWECRTLLRK